MQTRVVVIGASLSGLMGARALKERGISDFLVLDAKAAIGLPLKCGEAVEARSMVDLFGESILEESFVLNRISRHQVAFGTTTREFFFDYLELDRPAFERWLSQDLHSHIRCNTRVLDLVRTTNGFRVVTGEEAIECNAVLVACGANYTLHDKLFSGKLIRPRLGYAFGGLYRGEGPSDRFIWKIEKELEGYSWSFPKRGGIVNAGAAGIHAKELRTSLTRFLSREGISDKPHPVLGGHYPISGPLKRTFFANALLAGDAAGFVFAGTGEGISYALWSGYFAGKTLAEAAENDDFSASRLSRYEFLWKKQFYKKLRAGLRFQKLLSYFLRTGQFERVLKKIPEDWLRAMVLGEPIPLPGLGKYVKARIVSLVSEQKRRFSVSRSTETT